MEASAAGLAAGDGEAAQAQADNAGDGQQQNQPDLAALAGQLSDVPAQLEQMREWMEGFQQSQQPQQQAEPEPADLSYLDPESPTYDPQQAAQQLLNTLEQQNSTALTQALEPLQNEVAEMKASREADQLAAEFPDLQNPETANAVLKATQQWVQAAGLPAETANNMQVVRAVYMMGRAAELNATEQSQGQQQAASLEGAGGASPGGPGGGLTAESIISGGGARSPLPFG